MRTASIGNLMIDRVLPEDMRGQPRTLDKKGLRDLMREVALKHPEQYRQVSHDLAQIGQRVAFITGGNSFGLRHMLRTAKAEKDRQELQRRINQVLDNDNLTDEQRDQLIIKLTGRLSDGGKSVYEESLAEGNPLAYQVLSGSRGNPGNLASLRASDLLYTDHRDRTLPVPILRSYSQGLSPLEYWAGAYGARKGVMDTKFATQDAGFLCLAAGTLVRMADWSTKPIEAIRVGDVVLGADRRGRTFPVRVTATFANGRKPLRRFRFRYGKSRTRFLDVVATDSHRALCEHLRRRRRRYDTRLHIEITQDVRPLGEFERRTVSWHALVPPQGFVSRAGRHEPWAGLIGWLIAEGGLTTSQIGISCGDDELLAAGEALAASADFTLRRKGSAPYEYILQDQKKLPATGKPGGGIAVGTFRHRMRARLDQLGLLGKLASQKKIPAEVDQWSNKSVAELLRWLFAGDAGVYPSNNSSVPVITLGMTAKAVVQKAQQLLADRFGIYGQVYIADTKGRPCGVESTYEANHDTVGLSISDRESVEKFGRVIGFVAGSKQRQLVELLQRIEPCGRRDRFLFHFASVESSGLGETFDIEVDHPDHLFVLANGAIVSNSKQLNQIVHRALVTQFDREDEPDTLRGLPVDVEDDESEGALLAAPVAGYDRNTVITPKILQSLRARNIKRILVRSPAVGGPDDGGVYARDAGIREFGRLPERGQNIGMTAAQAMSEPLSQAQLSSKHAGGVAGASANQAVGGFDYINQLIQTPRQFKGGAAHAEVDGLVQRIEEAPAGGKYVWIENQRHYVNKDFNPLVQRGDHVEAGDVISDGVPNPSVIVRHKGVGEGRRYFINAFRQAFRDAGIKGHRRNIELLARGIINHVRLTEEVGEYVPDDIVTYQQLERSWKPRPGAQPLNPNAAVGRYLEKPYLHYSIGTKVRPSMLQDFRDFGITEVEAHDDPPPFEPEMVRGMANLQHDPDWMTRMFGSGLKSGLLSAVQRGGTSDASGTSFVPALARGVDFGRQGLVHKPEPWGKESSEKRAEPVATWTPEAARQFQLARYQAYRRHQAQQLVDRNFDRTLGSDTPLGAALDVYGEAAQIPGGSYTWPVQLVDQVFPMTVGGRPSEQVEEDEWAPIEHVSQPYGPLNPIGWGKHLMRGELTEMAGKLTPSHPDYEYAAVQGDQYLLPGSGKWVDQYNAAIRSGQQPPPHVVLNAEREMAQAAGSGDFLESAWNDDLARMSYDQEALNAELAYRRQLADSMLNHYMQALSRQGADRNPALRSKLQALGMAWSARPNMTEEQYQQKIQETLREHGVDPQSLVVNQESLETNRAAQARQREQAIAAAKNQYLPSQPQPQPQQQQAPPQSQSPGQAELDQQMRQPLSARPTFQRRDTPFALQHAQLAPQAVSGAINAMGPMGIAGYGLLFNPGAVRTLMSGPGGAGGAGGASPPKLNSSLQSPAQPQSPQPKMPGVKKPPTMKSPNLVPR